VKLLELAKKNLQEYISVRETLELISSTQQTPLSYVAIFLISQNFDTNIATYDVDRFFIVHSNDEFNWGTFQYTNSILSNLADNEKYKEVFTFDDSSLPENLANAYWKRSELYNLDLIKQLSIDFYFRVQDIREIFHNRNLNLKDFQFHDVFSDKEVITLLKSGIPSYLPDSVETYSLIESFIDSSLNFFELNFESGFEITRIELKQLFFDNQIIIKDFNDDLLNSEVSNSRNIWDENYLATLESGLLPEAEETFVSIESFQNVDERIHIQEDLPAYLKILLMNEYFSVVEAACLISKDDPSKVQALIDNNDLSYDAWHYSEHIQAMKVVKNAISTHRLDSANEGISRVSLQVFLFEKNYILSGFNDALPIHNGIVNISTLASNHHSLSKENEFLKHQLEKKEDQIQELITKLKIQTNELATSEESKLKSTRAENNVAKLILTLSSMAKIDVSKPYSPYESLRTEADLLGIDRFPSDENIAGWLKKANNQNPN